MNNPMVNCGFPLWQDGGNRFYLLFLSVKKEVLSMDFLLLEDLMRGMS